MTLLESLAQSMGPDVVGQIGKVVGLDDNLVQKGMQVAGPLVTGALASKASTPSGLDSLMGLLPSGGTGSGLGSIIGALAKSGLTGVPSSSEVFGGGASAITGTINKALGFDAGSLLTMAAPMVLGLVSQAASSQKLDKSGVAQLLQNEQAAFERQGGATASLVRSALDAGKQAVATKASYPADVWTKLRLAPLAAAQVVMGASPSGAIGTLKEVSALGDAVTAVKTAAGPTSILSLAFDGDITDDEAKTLGHDKAALLGTIKDAVDAVAARSPNEAQACRSFILDVATKVAESTKEGGFLGIGGTRVSDAEKAAIEEIRAAIGGRAAGAGA
jgi:Bacterial protein of unknown function (DUF937)